MFMQIVISYGWLVFSSTRIDPFLVEFRPDLRRVSTRSSTRKKPIYNNLKINNLQNTHLSSFFITHIYRFLISKQHLSFLNNYTHSKKERDYFVWYNNAYSCKIEKDDRKFNMLKQGFNKTLSIECCCIKQ